MPKLFGDSGLRAKDLFYMLTLFTLGLIQWPVLPIGQQQEILVFADHRAAADPGSADAERS